LCFDLQGNLLVSTLPESGQKGTVLKFDGTTWSTVYESPLPGYWISTMVIDAAGTLWLGELNREAIGNDYGGGLWSLTGNTLRNYTITNSSLSSNSIVELALDKQENLWIGTYSGGLVKFDRKNTWQTISSDNSPMPGLNSVELIRSDKEGNIWIAVQFFGLAVIKP
jgi:ligand-binding sensor domain-containing protein